MIGRGGDDLLGIDGTGGSSFMKSVARGGEMAGELTGCNIAVGVLGLGGDGSKTSRKGAT